MTTYDLVIRDGTLYDGLGGQPYVADVAVSAGIIAAVAPSLPGKGKDEIDARGKIVTPGFVDVHTHYDGQVTWESRLTPSSDHGVTTIVTGNCGVGFAPCLPQDRDDLISLMSGVEDIPEVVMAEGLPWNWETFPEYLESVASRPHDVDIAAMIPHSALRVYVMRERAIAREHATPEDVERMAALTREAMQAGALGFATSRALQQRSSRGQPIPTVRAAEAELRGILGAMAQTGGGVFQLLSDFDQFADTEGEFAMFRRLVSETGCPLSFTLNQKHRDPDGWRALLKMTEQASNQGLPIKAQVLGRPTGMLMGHELTYSPFTGIPTYHALAKLPFAERIAELRKAEVRSRILSEDTDPKALVSSAVRDFDHMFEVTDPPNYEPKPEESLAAKAKRAGIDPKELAYDLLLCHEGRGLLLEMGQNYANCSLEPSYEMMSHKDTILGLGDGGAHCGIICDASYPTTMIAYWSRDRERGPKLSLPWVIKALSHSTAAAVGLLDRGRIAVGYKADLNVIDYDRVQLCVPHVVYDLPTKARRIVQRATGYEATVVNGVVTYREGEPTGSLPGRVVRGAQSMPRAA
jgi:N-acyl-D-aspartate/D-glutamate deacylase